MDSMMTIFYENVREEGVHKITCQWIPFFLGENVERELNGERIQRDKITIGKKIFYTRTHNQLIARI